ncbi:MAG: peptidoglycan editing factor PgeF [Paludibacter sp.]
MVKSILLSEYNEIAHFCTSRQGGASVGNYASFNLSPFSGDQPVHLEENQRVLCQKLGIDSEKLIIPYQTHGTEIRVIDKTFFLLSASEKTQYLHGVDALITKLPRVCIGVTTADCVPLIFFDTHKKVVAVAHAGWRGTCCRIAEKTVRVMVEQLECKVDDILVTVGPSISVDVYNVGSELVETFQNEGFDTDEIFVEKGEKLHLDLCKANRQSLLKAGILPQHIEIAGICTYTKHDQFFSARRLGIKSGRMLSGVMLAPKSPKGDLKNDLLIS